MIPDPCIVATGSADQRWADLSHSLPTSVLTSGTLRAQRRPNRERSWEGSPGAGAFALPNPIPPLNTLPALAIGQEKRTYRGRQRGRRAVMDGAHCAGVLFLCAALLI